MSAILAMPAVAQITDRLNGTQTALAIKAPVAAVATSNITLEGEQTVGGVAVTDGDRVLVTAQTDSSDNGIYVVDSSEWDRAADFDGNRDVAKGTLVTVNRSGSVGRAVFYQVTSSDPITIGTSDIDFVLLEDPNAQYELTAAEAAAGLDAGDISEGYEPGDIRRYGGLGDDSSNNDAALTAMIEQHEQSGACGFIPSGVYRYNTTITALNYSGWCIRGEGWVLTRLKYMGASDGIVVTGRYGILEGVWLLNGDSSGSNGIVLHDANSVLLDAVNVGGGGGGLETQGWINDGVLIDEDYDTPTGNNNSIHIRNSFFGFNNIGIEIAIGADHNAIILEGNNASANIADGFLLRGQAGRLYGGILEGNGTGGTGYGARLGLDGDGTVVTTWIIDGPYVESNATGGIRGSAVSQANQIILDGLNVNSGYTGDAAAENISVWVDNNSGGIAMFGQDTQRFAIYNTTVGGVPRVQLLAEGSSSNIPLWIYSKGTSPIVLNESVGTGVVIGGQSVDASALLQVDSTSKGVLLPRLTNAQEAAISGPDDGLIWYNSETDKLMIRANGANVAVH